MAVSNPWTSLISSTGLLDAISNIANNQSGVESLAGMIFLILLNNRFEKPYDINKSEYDEMIEISIECATDIYKKARRKYLEDLEEDEIKEEVE